MATRGRAVAGVVGGLLVVAVAVLGLSTELKTPGAARAESAPPPREAVTVEVERAVLVDRLVTRGTVASAGAIEYTPPSSSSGGTSRLEVLREPGESVGAGDVVALVDGRPVFVLEGQDQLGADITPLSVGRDVERLQAALRGLGASIPDSESGKVGAATQSAIRSLYEDAGFRVDTTAEPGGVQQSPAGESLELKIARLQRAVIAAEESLDAAVVAAGSQPDARTAALIGVAAAQRKLDQAIADRAVAIGDALEALAVARKGASTTTTTTSSTSTPGGASDQPSGGPGAGSGASGVSAVRQAEMNLRDAQRMGDAAIAEAETQLRTAQAQLDEAVRSTVVTGAQADQQVGAAELALQAAQQELAEAGRRDGVILNRAEVLFVPTLPTTVLSVSPPSSGAAAAAGVGPLFTLRSGELIVEVNVPAGVLLSDGAKGVAESDDGETVLTVEASAFAGAGQPPPPDATGVGGLPGVESAGSDPGGGSDSGDTTPFVITGTEQGTAVAGENLRVTVSTPVTDEAVLSVPLRAIVTGPDGNSSLRVLKDDGSFREVPVRAGRTGNGMVEVLPALDGQLLEVDEGDQVRVS